MVNIVTRMTFSWTWGDMLLEAGGRSGKRQHLPRRWQSDQLSGSEAESQTSEMGKAQISPALGNNFQEQV